MFLKELFKNRKSIIAEGGNLEIDNPKFDPAKPESPENPKKLQAQEIQLAPTEISDEVQDRTHMVGVLKKLFTDINNTFNTTYKTQLFQPKLLDQEIQDFMAGSSQHFFDLLRPNPNFNPKQPESKTNPKMIGISDEEFKKYKPKVGDIDIQCNQELQDQLFEFLNNYVGSPIGNATLLGNPSQGNEQYNTLWQLTDPPIKIQIDFEYGRYAPETGKPDEWTKFSHSSSWDDIQQNIKGVFHKYIYRALAKSTPQTKYVARLAGLGKKRAMAIFGGSTGKEPVADYNNPPEPFVDANFSFAVASKGGGGIRAKYKPLEPDQGLPTEINGIPVMQELKSSDSEYIQDLNKQFQLFYNRAPQGNDRQLQGSFVGTLELMNKYLDNSAKRTTVSDFLDILFEPGSQMITKDDPKRDYAVKFAAVDKMLEVLGLQDMTQDAEAMAQAYEKDFLDVDAFKKANPNEKQPRAAMLKQRTASMPATEELDEADEEGATVKAQLRKGMPHLHDLKPADLLDLLDEIHDGNGKFKLENIPLNVKVDGFGGRFGKNADGKPFMGTSRTEPRYSAGFVAYHQKKGTTDPEVLGRAQIFDQLFGEMMNAVGLVDEQLGPDFLVNKQVTCEVLFLPFAKEQEDGRLKFVGISYDKLPEGVQLALVPFRVTDATTGEDLPDTNKIVKSLTGLGQQGSVMFINNSLVQKEGLDVTAIVPPLENIETFKSMLAGGKRDAKKEVIDALKPVAQALENAIINDPNILGKDMLGQDYEGIVINSRLGPIKVTSQEQRDVITSKNAAKASARTERPRGESKTAVVAIGSFVGHIGHEQLFDYTVKKAAEVGGDPYLFIGNAQGKDDPIPPSVKVQTWHKLYPEYSKNISTVNEAGGSLLQKIKHELINPLPGKPPRYDNVIIMVGEDQAGLTMPQALMKAVNKFPGYEHVKVSLEATPRGTGMSFTRLRNILKDPNATEQQQFDLWGQAFDVKKLGADWIKHLMDLTRKGMGIQKEPQAPAPQQPAPRSAPQPVLEQRLFNSLIRPATKQGVTEGLNEFAISGGDDGEDPFDNYPCYDCGSTIFLHHTKLCDLAEPNAKHDLPARPGSQHWTGEIPKGLHPIPGLQEGVAEAFQNDESNLFYIYDKSSGRLKQRMIQNLDEPKARSAGYRDSVDDALKHAGIIRSKFDPKKFIQNQGGKWIQVFPFGEQGVAEARMSAATKLQRAWDRERAKSQASRDRFKRELDAAMPAPNPEPKKEEPKKEGVVGAVAGGALGAYATKNARGAMTGAKIGSKIQDKLTTEKIKGADGKACWDGYRYNGNKNGKDSCVKVSESVEDIMDVLINKIIVNEAISNNRK